MDRRASTLSQVGSVRYRAEADRPIVVVSGRSADRRRSTSDSVTGTRTTEVSHSAVLVPHDHPLRFGRQAAIYEVRLPERDKGFANLSETKLSIPIWVNSSL